MKTLLLTREDVRAVAQHVGLDELMDEAIEALTLAFGQFDRSQTLTPVRSGFQYELPVPGLVEWMPAMSAGRAASIKLVGYHPTNPANRGLPTVLSTILTFDLETGHLTTLSDATFLTALRTGAASAVASSVLAASDTRTLGLLGCGAQAVTQLHAMSRLFDLERVLIHDTDTRVEASFAARAYGFGLPSAVAVTAAAPQTILAESDVVCTQTSVAPGAGPIVADVPTRAHLHVNAVGSDFPGKTELPRTLLERSLVVPDFRSQALHEGECQVLDPADLGPDLDQIVRDAVRYESHRASSTVFDSTGWALEDHVMIELLAAHARRLGLGQPVALEAIPEDPANPYEAMAQPRADDEPAPGRYVARA